MTTSHRPVFRRIATGLALMALSLASFAALAQSAPTPGDLAGLMSATPSGDWSMKLWKYLFGDFAENPFSPGGPSTLLGNIFVIFNTAIFTVGFAWALYGVIGGVVQTAHEGEVLGKRMSTVWYPIRTVVGIVGMVPIFQGFTMFQAVMMLLTTVGIGIGNSLWTAGVESTSQMQALINEAKFEPSAVSDTRKAVHNVFLSGVCMAAQRDSESRHSPPLAPSQLVRDQPYEVRTRMEGGYRFGSQDDPQKCGAIFVQASGRSEDAMFAFRAGGVDYNRIKEISRNAYVSGLNPLVSSTMNVANNWYAERARSLASGAVAPEVPLEQLDAIAREFMANTHAAITAYNVDGGALKASVKKNMTELGWFGAGAWYSTLAEANAAIADASKGASIASIEVGGGVSQLETTTTRAVDAAADGLSRAQSNELASSGDGSRAILDSAIKDFCSVGGADMSSSMGTATGNCSLGQSIVSGAIRAAAIGSGGGGNGDGSIGFDSAGLVNPLIMMKNIGDHVMSFSSTVLIGGAAIEFLASRTPVGKVLGAASSLPGGEKSGLAKWLPNLAGAWEILKMVAIVLLVLGAFLSIYLPLVPFITWMGAILAYAASVIEGLAGASLHAMAHLDGEGDGMGQRTAHGYIFFINVLARPALMVIGFFVASALMIVVGTLQAHLFLPAMANVQGNSVTGMFSIGAFLIIFGVMNVTLISACFNLIYVLTDQVIGFVGGNISSHMGRETEDKAHNVFLMAGRFGPGAMQQAAGLRGAALKKAAEGAGKDAGGKKSNGG